MKTLKPAQQEQKMKNLKVAPPSRTWGFIRLTLAIGSAFLFLVVLLYGFGTVSPAYADPGTLYVDGAGGSDTPACGTMGASCKTISHTLNTRANEGDTLLITTGTYTENLTITGITVTLRGGYTISDTLWLTNTGETVIDGGDAGRVLFIHDSNPIVENLTISGGAAESTECWGDAVWVTNGEAVIRSSTIKDNNGGCGGIEVNHDFGPGHLTLESSTVSNMQGNGALHVRGEFASATIADVTFTGNTADFAGGAIYVDFGSSAVISNSRIISNTANDMGGGIVVWDGATAVISNSQIYANTALGAGGGGIGVNEATLNIANSWLMDNNAPNGQSGGIDVRSNSMVNVMDSIIAGNITSDHGGAATIDPGATLNLTNTLITGNATTSGNANVLGVNGDVTIMNSTISDNNPQGAQAVILWSGHLTITNSILWNNALNLQADPPCPACFAVTYSNIEGGWTGTGNIDVDPLFTGGDDYRLQTDSPCIDAGTNTGAPDHDLDQEPRPQDGDGDGTATADIGAYEFGRYWIYLPLTFGNFGS